MMKYIICTLAGGAFGYLVLYKLIGCSGGSCPITANPYTSTIYGIVLGLLLAFSLAPNKEKAKPNVSESSSSLAGDEETSTSPLKAEYKKISAKEAKQRMDSKDDLIVLDVRTEAEFEAGHIPGAVLLPNEDIGATKPDILPNLDAEILIYCRSGYRSAIAAKKLIDLGYTNVYDFGGIIDWDYEVVKD